MDRKGVVNTKESAKRTKGGVLVSSIQLSDLRPYFHRSAEEASKELGVGLTVLKRRCRELGVSRWPYRQIACVDKLIDFVQVDKTLDEDEAEEKLNELLKYKEHMLNGKTTQLPAWAKRAQQHLSKMNYRARVSRKSNGSVDSGSPTSRHRRTTVTRSLSAIEVDRHDQMASIGHFGQEDIVKLAPIQREDKSDQESDNLVEYLSGWAAPDEQIRDIEHSPCDVTSEEAVMQAFQSPIQSATFIPSFYFPGFYPFFADVLTQNSTTLQGRLIRDGMTQQCGKNKRPRNQFEFAHPSQLVMGMAGRCIKPETGMYPIGKFESL